MIPDRPQRQESLHRIRQMEARVNNTALQAARLDFRRSEIDRQLPELEQEYPEFTEHGNRYLFQALLFATAPLFIALYDFIILSTFNEWMIQLAGFADSLNLKMRFLATLSWIAAGLLIGCLLKPLRHLQPSAWSIAAAVIVVLFAALYIASPFLINTIVAVENFPAGPSRLGPLFVSVLVASLVLISGAHLPQSMRYLSYLAHKNGLRRQRRRLMDARYRLAGEAVTRFGQLLNLVEQQRQRFNEQVEIRLTEAARQLINEASHGRFEVRFTDRPSAVQPTAALPSAEAQTTPSGPNPAPQQPQQPESPPPDPSPNGATSRPAEPPPPSTFHDWADLELRPPNSFDQRLP